MRKLQTRNSIQVVIIMEIISHCIYNAAVITIIFSSNSPKRSSGESGNKPWEKENGQLTLLLRRKRQVLDIMVRLCLYI